MGDSPPPITPEFNHTPTPEVSQSFDSAAMSDAQAQQLDTQKQNLEAQRAVPEMQGTEYTYGGTVEQAVHQSTNERMAPDREREIAGLAERLERRNAVTVEQKPEAPMTQRERDVQELAAKFKQGNKRKL